MGVITALCWLVGISLFVAASLKVWSFRDFSAELRSYDAVPLIRSVTSRVSNLGAGLLIAAETATLPLMLYPGTFSLGCLLAAILLLGFTAATSRQVSSGTKEISCACFGRSSRPLSWVVPSRSLIMSIPVALGLAIDRPGEISGAAFVAATLVAALVALVLEVLQTRVTIDRTITSDLRGQL